MSKAGKRSRRGRQCFDIHFSGQHLNVSNSKGKFAIFHSFIGRSSVIQFLNEFANQEIRLIALVEESSGLMIGRLFRDPQGQGS